MFGVRALLGQAKVLGDAPADDRAVGPESGVGDGVSALLDQVQSGAADDIGTAIGDVLAALELVLGQAPQP